LTNSKWLSLKIGWGCWVEEEKPAPNASRDRRLSLKGGLTYPNILLSVNKKNLYMAFFVKRAGNALEKQRDDGGAKAGSQESGAGSRESGGLGNEGGEGAGG
jgi:hypothetical protein